jgi:type II secretory pathway pseudopilin PulG
MRKIFYQEEGFTLLEIFLVIFLLAIVSGLFYNSYFDGTRSFAFNKNRIEIQRAQDVTNRWLSRYIRIADVSDINTNGGDQLYFDTITDPVNSIGYYIDNDNLYLDINGNKRQICDCKFQDISFNYSSSLNVVEFSATIIIDENREPYTFSSIFYPRVQN